VQRIERRSTDKVIYLSVGGGSYCPLVSVIDIGNVRRKDERVILMSQIYPCLASGIMRRPGFFWTISNPQTKGSHKIVRFLEARASNVTSIQQVSEVGFSEGIYRIQQAAVNEVSLFRPICLELLEGRVEGLPPLQICPPGSAHSISVFEVVAIKYLHPS
jgi:hypothetical protein